MNELALFAGAGGGILGGKLLGWRTICAVELDAYCRDVLLARQRDGLLPRFPIWDDVRTFDGRPWRGHVDVISGGFPCQDISAAGTRRGLAGARSGLVFEMLRIIDEVRPAFVLAENSPHLRTNGLGVIIQELSRMGYVGRVGVLGARHVGANHRRDRMWIVASDRIPDVAEPSGEQVGPRGQSWEHNRMAGVFHAVANSHGGPRSADWWSVAQFEGMDDGVANRMDRVRATGNGQVPAVAALAWEVLSG